MGQRQTSGAARAQARDDRCERDGAAGDGFHQTDLHQRAPSALRALGGKGSQPGDASARQGRLHRLQRRVPGSVPADILPELTPAAGEPVLPPLGPDKFIGSELEKTLKDKGIKTVVAMGTQAQTSVLHTAGAAALRGFKVARWTACPPMTCSPNSIPRGISPRRRASARR